MNALLGFILAVAGLAFGVFLVLHGLGLVGGDGDPSSTDIALYSIGVFFALCAVLLGASMTRGSEK